MLIKLEQNIGGTKNSLSLIHGKHPVSVFVKSGSPGVVTFSDLSESTAVCISCPDQPCINFAIDDRDSHLAGMFRLDHNTNVCAVNAISWSDIEFRPVIADDTCIGCGVCVARCPTKAIYLLECCAKISNVSSPYYEINNEEGHQKTKEIFLKTQILGTYHIESDQIITVFLQKLRRHSRRSGTLNSNLLVRNLLRTLGVPAETYAKGVQYGTVDILFRIGNVIGAGEVELGNSAIDAPRNLAGIVAFLASRNNIERKRITTISFLSKLPQGREQYWMVVDDMKKVLDLEIQTLTISSMLLMVWSRITLELPNSKLLLSQKNFQTLRPFLEVSIKRKIELSSGFENQLEPSKLIDSFPL